MRALTLGVGLLAGLLMAATARAEPPPVEFLPGDAAWQPGDRWRSGPGWLGLDCVELRCRLAPARLAVVAGRGPDGERGQQLSFTLSGPARPGARVLAWFKADARLPWLAARPLPTYAADTAPPKRPASPGTLEVAVGLPGGRAATLVPLYDKARERFLLQLRLPGQRQMLEELGACSHAVPSDFLLWAGDLDGDGKPDFLISYIDGDGEVHLYLGAQAEARQIVGLAGSYVAPPVSAACADAEWRN